MLKSTSGSVNQHTTSHDAFARFESVFQYKYKKAFVVLLYAFLLFM